MINVQRRHVLAAGALLGAGMAVTRSPGAAADDFTVAADLDWHALGEPEGRGWRSPETTRLTDRLPAHAEGIVPDTVWQRSRMSSSLSYRFRTDADSIAAQWTLPSELTEATYLTQGSANGMDLYARDDEGQWRWASWGVPSAGGRVSRTLISSMVPVDGVREWTIYLPLYNRTDDVLIGVPAGARFEIMEPDPTPPIVYYGTSIVHGAGASRPGMALPSRLSRRLDRPVVGLGFSGVAKMEVELASLLAEVSAAAYLIDCLPNMTPAQVADRTVPFVQRLREERPDTPILLIEERTRANSWIRAGWMADHRARREALRAGYQTLRRAGDDHLHYMSHKDMFGTDSEGTIDGSHPTDLGVTRMLDVLEPQVRKII